MAATVLLWVVLVLLGVIFGIGFGIALTAKFREYARSELDRVSGIDE